MQVLADSNAMWIFPRTKSCIRQGSLYIQFWLAIITFQLSHFQACCILWATLGFKKATKVCFIYPALVLTPCFGTWTFGPAVQNNESTSNSCMSCESNEISVSYKHTWVTFGISLIGAIVAFFVGYEPAWQEVSDFGKDPHIYYWEPQAAIISLVLTTVVLPILIGFVQAVDKCQKCCTCCPTKCFPVIQRTELDVDNME